MSVLIKGMKMQKPKLTDMISVYNAYVLVSPNGHAAIVVDNEDGLDSTEYPLVEVPESHGRLIDADALIKKCEEMADKEDGNQLDALVLLRWFLEQNAPTIIPASEEGKAK